MNQNTEQTIGPGESISGIEITPRTSKIQASNGEHDRDIHHLKTWPEYFHVVKEGKKTFEVRKKDRDFKEGDILFLKEWNPETEEFTGEMLEKEITYILPGGAFGLSPAYVVMSIVTPKYLK